MDESIDGWIIHHSSFITHHSSLIIHHHHVSFIIDHPSSWFIHARTHTRAHTHTHAHTRAHTRTRNRKLLSTWNCCTHEDHEFLIFVTSTTTKWPFSMHYTKWSCTLNVSISIICIDWSHGGDGWSYPELRRRKVRLDFTHKSSWVTAASRRVYHKVNQRCTWVVTVNS